MKLTYQKKKREWVKLLLTLQAAACSTIVGKHKNRNIRIDYISCFFTRRVVLSLLVAELFLSCFV